MLAPRSRIIAKVILSLELLITTQILPMKISLYVPSEIYPHCKSAKIMFLLNTSLLIILYLASNKLPATPDLRRKKKKFILTVIKSRVLHYNIVAICRCRLAGSVKST